MNESISARHARSHPPSALPGLNLAQSLPPPPRWLCWRELESHRSNWCGGTCPRLDPGSLDAEDQASNVMALQTGARIFSAYEVGDCRERVWVITDAKDDDGHRLSTCVLMPADY